MSEFVETAIKIKFIREGYLPDYPYHLVSKDEMLDAFFTTYMDENGDLVDEINTEDFFHTVYYLPSGFDSLQTVYDELHRAVQYIVFYWKKLQTMAVSTYEFTLNGITYQLNREALPDWIYSFMMGRVICDSSDVRDRHSLLDLLGCKNLLDSMTLEAATRCYEVSSQWIARLPVSSRRPATIFGEMHVIKSLRLQQQGEV